MIDKEKYKEVLEEGLSLDHYFLLCSIKNSVKPVENKRIQGFYNLLAKKGYIENDELTEKGIDLVQNCEFSEIITVVDTVEKGKEKEIDFGSWALEVHKACEDKILELTGKKQYFGVLENKRWAFLCNARDLAKNLQKVIALYKLKDHDKIKRTMIRHIEKCHDSKNWFPVMYYYLIKFGKSDLVTEMDSLDEQEDTSSSMHKLM